jgi:RNA polymerase sigma factor (sigma-70 family)
MAIGSPLPGALIQKRRWISARMNNDFTKDEFERFLSWLNPDHELAAKKYEEVRRRLIKIFACRGCTEAEDLADETITRVIRKVQVIIDTYVGEPVLYFYGVARHVYHEWLRKNCPASPPPPPDPPEQKEQAFECLENCLGKCSDKDRRLILEYYKDERREKIDHRKEMAKREGIALNALRIKMHRIRTSLQSCVTGCLKRASAG